MIIPQHTGQQQYSTVIRSIQPYTLMQSYAISFSPIPQHKSTCGTMVSLTTHIPIPYTRSNSDCITRTMQPYISQRAAAVISLAACNPTPQTKQQQYTGITTITLHLTHKATPIIRNVQPCTSHKATAVFWNHYNIPILHTQSNGKDVAGS